MTTPNHAWRASRSRSRPIVSPNLPAAKQSQPGPPKSTSNPSDFAPPSSPPDSSNSAREEKNGPLGDHAQSASTWGLHIRRVPADVWKKAHSNAVQSDLTLREYVIAVLANSEPLDPGS